VPGEEVSVRKNEARRDKRDFIAKQRHFGGNENLHFARLLDMIRLR